jgi:hypothetical protein
VAFGSRISQVAVVLGFLAVIFGVPTCQIVVELRQQRPVQATDVFRHAPTVKNLRNFEQALEDSWWGQGWLRPWTQQGLFLLLRDTGAKALEGREGWMFYRPGVRYLTEKNRLEVGPGDSVWASPPTGETRRDSVGRAIVEYRDQLRQRGIELLVVPVPSKASVYPDMLTRRFAGRPGDFRSPTEDLLEELGQRGVRTVHLFDAFRRARRNDTSSGSGKAYYLAEDTHWTPEGARIAARAVAEGLRELGWTWEHPLSYTTQEAWVSRRGDILEMTSLAVLPEQYRAEKVRCEQILDPLVGPMVSQVGGRAGRFKNDHLIDTPMESSVLLLGDSFCRIYQAAEPASLGEVIRSESAEDLDLAPWSTEPGGETGGDGEKALRRKKRLLPGSAGFPSLLAYELKSPVDYVISDGGAATDVRQRLSVDSEILENKRVVIWEFAEREVRYGKAGWSDVPLPPEL